MAETSVEIGAEIRADEIDAARIADVVAAIGPDRHAALVVTLIADIAAIDPAAPTTAIFDLLHRLRGSAATLGLAALAAALAAAEAGIADGDRLLLDGLDRAARRAAALCAESALPQAPAAGGPLASLLAKGGAKP
jgi:HPt (histidine-containing phosphotransfer) domain-containing protein